MQTRSSERMQTPSICSTKGTSTCEKGTTQHTMILSRSVARTRGQIFGRRESASASLLTRVKPDGRAMRSRDKQLTRRIRKHATIVTARCHKRHCSLWRGASAELEARTDGWTRANRGPSAQHLAAPITGNRTHALKQPGHGSRSHEQWLRQSHIFDQQDIFDQERSTNNRHVGPLAANTI